MLKEKKFSTPRAIRNTAKQSLLILGQPDFLYRDKIIKETFIVINEKRKSIGHLGDDVHIALVDLAEGKNTKIIRITKTNRSPVTSIEGFPSVSIQKYKKDTMLVVPAADESTLIEKVSKLKELLESKGAILQERCNWICVVDKAKIQTSNEEILKKESIAKIRVPEMSEHTKSLHDIALKAIKQQEKRP